MSQYVDYTLTEISGFASADLIILLLLVVKDQEVALKRCAVEKYKDLMDWPTSWTVCNIMKTICCECGGRGTLLFHSAVSCLLIAISIRQQKQDRCKTSFTVNICTNLCPVSNSISHDILQLFCQKQLTLCHCIAKSFYYLFISKGKTCKGLFSQETKQGQLSNT